MIRVGPLLRRSSVLLLPGLAHAVSIGTPAPALPEMPDYLNVVWHNDVYGGEVGSNPDDFRTNGFTLQWRFRPLWHLAVDYHNLTNRGGAFAEPARSDEITLSISRALLRYEDGEDAAWLALGAGLRANGDFGGDTVQNGWHRAFGIQQIDLPYEESDARPVLSMAWHAQTATRGGWNDWDISLAAGTSLGISTTGGVVVNDQEIQADLNARLHLRGAHGGLWTGLRSSMRAGDTQNPTADVVNFVERGNWLTFGLQLGNFFAEGRVNLDTELSAGLLGWQAQPRVHLHRFGGEQITYEVGPVLGDFAINMRLRWQPHLLHDRRPADTYTETYVSYGFGHAPGQEPDQSELRYQQFTAGFDTALWAPRGGFSWTPYAQYGFGWRQEEITPDNILGPFSRHREESPVLEFGLGARLLYGPLSKHAGGIRYGLAASYVYRWVIEDSIAVAIDGSKFEYLRDKGDVHLQAVIEAAW